MPMYLTEEHIPNQNSVSLNHASTVDCAEKI